MIFVTLGSQKFQFNRLLVEIDKLIEEGVISEEVFAQIGSSDYLPKHYAYKIFLNKDEFSEWQNKCDIVITHGGTGAIIGAVKKDKKVIAVPRLAKYGEHVDDHQVQLLKQFEESNIISVCYDLNDLGVIYQQLPKQTFAQYKSNQMTIVNDIKSYLVTVKMEKTKRVG